MGCLQSKLDSKTVDSGVDAAAKNKDKISAGIKSAGQKAGISTTVLDGGVKQVLTDSDGLKATINKSLGNEATVATTTVATPEGTATATVVTDAAAAAPVATTQ